MGQAPIKVRDLWKGFSFIEGRPSEPPVVSVILPTYRRASSGLLQRAVRSVLQQSFRQFQLILVDDGSQDGTADYLTSIAAEDRRVSYYRFPKNSGLPALAVNFGITRSNASVLAFMFDDDLWYPNALRDLLEEISKPGRDVVYGKVRMFYRTSSGRESWAPLGEISFSHPDLLRRNMVSNNAVMLRKEVLDRVGMYDPHILIRRLTDWDLWRRTTRQFSMFQVDTWIGEIWGPASPDSLGVSVRSNWDIMAKYMMIERDELLKPSVIGDFVVNDCSLLASNFSTLDMPMVHEVMREYYAQVGDLGNLKMAEADVGDAFKVDPKTHPAPRLLLSRQIFDALPQIYFLNYLESQVNSHYSYRLVGEPEMRFSDLVGCDVLILVRTLTEESIRALRMAKRLGKKVIYFVDDNFLRISEDFEPRTVRELMGDKRTLGNFKALVSESNLVVVSTEAMAAELEPIARNIHVLPPSIPQHYLLNCAKPRKDSNKLKIGHVGTGYRAKEFELLAPAIEKVAEELAGKVQFEFWGVNVFKLMPASLPLTYRRFVLDYKKYLNSLSSAGFDILLTPLLDTPYRNCKSYIKYLETAVAQAAGIYSDTRVFSRVVKNNETGLLVANNPDDWATAMLRLAEDRELRDAIIEKSREDIRLNHTTEATVGRFNKIFEMIDVEDLPTYPSLLLRINELVESTPDLLRGPSVVGSIPGVKLLRAGQVFRPIEIMLAWADRACEIGARILRMRHS